MGAARVSFLPWEPPLFSQKDSSPEQTEECLVNANNGSFQLWKKSLRKVAEGVKDRNILLVQKTRRKSNCLKGEQ